MNLIFKNFKKLVAKTIVNYSYFLFVKSNTHFIYSFLYDLQKKALKLIPVTPFFIINHKIYIEKNVSSSLIIAEYNDRQLYTNHVSYNLDSPNPLIPVNSQGLLLVKHAFVKIQGNSDFIICKDYYTINEFGYNMDPNYSNIDGILWRQKNNYALLKYCDRKITKEIESGIQLSGKFSSNYYHILYEILIRLIIINSSVIPKNVPLIVDESIFGVQSYLDLFNTLNKSNRTIIKIKKTEVLSVGSLYCLTPINSIPPHISNYSNINVFDIYFDSNILLQMRQYLLKVKSSSKYSTKIFISRKVSKNRKYNEDEIIKLVSKYGFSVLSPEKYCLFDQISIFNGANIIIGASGAAFSNILFCQENCKIICFQAREMDLPIFSTIARIVKSNMSYIIGKPKGIQNKNSIHSNFKVNIDQLKIMLDSIIKE